MKSKDKVSWFIAFNFFNRFPPFFPFYSLLLLRLFRRVIPPPRGSHCWQGAQPPYHSLCIAGGSSDMLPLSHYAIFTPFLIFLFYIGCANVDGLLPCRGNEDLCSECAIFKHRAQGNYVHTVSRALPYAVYSTYLSSGLSGCWGRRPRFFVTFFFSSLLLPP